MTANRRCHPSTIALALRGTVAIKKVDSGSGDEHFRFR